MNTNQAYKIATAHYLTKTMTELELETATDKHLTESYECFAIEDIKREIKSLVKDILKESREPLFLIAKGIIAKDSIMDLVDYADRLPSDMDIVINTTDIKLLAMCYAEELEEPKSLEDLLSNNIQETLREHYGLTPEQIRDFIAHNLYNLTEESYQAQTEHLMTAVNKFTKS